MLEKFTDLKSHGKRALVSFCVANPLVVRTILKSSLRKDEGLVLFEATSNQVNHRGGYTGMLPADYKEMVCSTALEIGFPIDRMMFGGDHLGPLPFSDMPASYAMSEAEKMVRSYVLAGYQKIHIDTSMALGGENNPSKELVASRGVRLISVAESAYKELKEKKGAVSRPFYIIGSEVPPAGGKKHEEKVQISSVTDIQDTLSAYKEELNKGKLGHVWERIAALVIQPGVEFGNETVDEFSIKKFENISSAIEGSDIAFEAHSTDYQTKDSLKSLVDNRFAILKVGPALTKSLTEALFKLEEIEKITLPHDVKVRSNFREILVKVMKESPKSWQNYYYDNIDLDLQHSLLDRSRYYLGVPEVKMALERLLLNFESQRPIAPAGLIRFYFPEQFRRINWRTASAFDFLSDYVSCQIEDYDYAASL